MDDVTTYADEHEGGQLRIACTGEQVPLLGLPDSAIPTSGGPARVDVTPPAIAEPIEGQTELAPRVLGSDAATALGRFEVDGPSGYRARSGGPVRETRAEAEADELAAFDEAIREQTGTHPADPEPDFAELHRQRLEGHTGRRERLERKAEKRREWAESRERKSSAALEGARRIADGIPFGQPILVGHHSEGRHRRDVARIENGMRSGLEHGRMAQEHEQKADGLEEQLRGAIYSDDVDAVERLEQKLRGLEQKRETMKSRNAAYRREHRAELKTMSPYERGLVSVRWPDGSVTGMRPAFFLRAVERQPADVLCSRCGEVLPEELVALIWTDTDFYEHGDHLAAFEPTAENFAAARAIHAAHVAPGDVVHVPPDREEFAAG